MTGNVHFMYMRWRVNERSIVYTAGGSIPLRLLKDADDVTDR